MENTPQEWQARQSYVGNRSAIISVRDINRSLEKALETDNRDTVLWIRELRRRMNMTQAKFAEAIGVGTYIVTHGESGKARPNDPDIRAKLIEVGQRYDMPPLPPARENVRGSSGPYFPEGLEDAFRQMYGG